MTVRGGEGGSDCVGESGRERGREGSWVGWQSKQGGIRLIKASICQRLSLKRKRSSEHQSAVFRCCALRAV